MIRRWPQLAAWSHLASAVCPGARFRARAKGSRVPRCPLMDRGPERSGRIRASGRFWCTGVPPILPQARILPGNPGIRPGSRPARTTRHHRTRPPGRPDRGWPGTGRSDPDRRFDSQPAGRAAVCTVDVTRSCVPTVPSTAPDRTPRTVLKCHRAPLTCPACHRPLPDRSGRRAADIIRCRSPRAVPAGWSWSRARRGPR
jgi:hypothetical protein